MEAFCYLNYPAYALRDLHPFFLGVLYLELSILLFSHCRRVPTPRYSIILSKIGGDGGNRIHNRNIASISR